MTTQPVTEELHSYRCVCIVTRLYREVLCVDARDPIEATKLAKALAMNNAGLARPYDEHAVIIAMDREE